MTTTLFPSSAQTTRELGRRRARRGGPQAHPARRVRVQVASVGTRGCALDPTTSTTWRLTGRGLGLVLAIGAVLAVAALVCVGGTMIDILTSPVYARP